MPNAARLLDLYPATTRDLLKLHLVDLAMPTGFLCLLKFTVATETGEAQIVCGDLLSHVKLPFSIRIT